MADTHDDRRQSSTQRGYGHAWQKARVGFLKNHPLCKMHLDLGRVVAATVVDHIRPHRGDQGLFWDKANWQALCKGCHDSAKKIQESTGTLPGCNLSGIPVDPLHHWHRN